MARLAAHKRRRRWVMAAGALVAAAAVVTLLARPRGDGWRVERAVATIGARAGVRLADGARLVIGDDGSVELSRGARRVALAGPATARTRGEALELERGAGRLFGDGTTALTPAARVIALGVDAEIELQVEMETEMTKKNIAATVIGGALLSVYVVHGGARVEPLAGGRGPTMLNAGDRAVMGSPDGPAVAMRASPSSASPAGLPSTKLAEAPRSPIARQPAPTVPGAASGAPAATAPSGASISDEGALDKEEIRASIIKILPQIKDCYEAGLEKNPNLAGKVRVQFTIRRHDGKGVVDNAEVTQLDGDDLDAPLTEMCLLQSVAAAEFPAPSGDEPVIVTYPFVLKPAADEHD
jgi:hypothetical protein